MKICVVVSVFLVTAMASLGDGEEPGVILPASSQQIFGNEWYLWTETNTQGTIDHTLDLSRFEMWEFGQDATTVRASVVGNEELAGNPFVRVWVHTFDEDSGVLVVKDPATGAKLFSGTVTFGVTSVWSFTKTMTITVDGPPPTPVVVPDLTVTVLDSSGAVVSTPTLQGASVYTPISLVFFAK